MENLLETIVQQSAEIAIIAQLLRKPFREWELSAAVRHALELRAASAGPAG